MPRIKEQAVCIRLVDWSETSQVVTLLTQQHGKVSGVAKGSKRASPSTVARFSGGIELLTMGQVVAVIKVSHELAAITEWDLQQPYSHLRQDLQAHHLAMYAADLVGSLIADRDAHPTTFHALTTYLAELVDRSGRGAALLRFQWRILQDCGYRPQLDKDAASGEKLAEVGPYLFDAQVGGFTAASSRQLDATSEAGPWRVRQQTLAILRAVAADQAIERRFTPEAIARANRLLCVYARSILDRELPTMAFVLDAAT